MSESFRSAPCSPYLVMIDAHMGMELSLPMADSIILATTRLHDANLWPQYDHFRNLPVVRYFPKCSEKIVG